MTKAELLGKLSLLLRNEKEITQILKFLVKSKLLEETHRSGDDYYYHLPEHQNVFPKRTKIICDNVLPSLKKEAISPRDNL